MKYITALIILSSLALNVYANETTVTIVNINGVNYLHESNHPKEIKPMTIGISWEKTDPKILARNPKNEQQFSAIHSRAQRDYTEEQKKLDEYNERIREQNKRNNNP